MVKKNKPSKGAAYIPMEDFDPKNNNNVAPDIDKVPPPKAP